MDLKELEAVIKKLEKVQKDARYSVAYRVASVEARIGLLQMQVELLKQGSRDDENDGM